MRDQEIYAASLLSLINGVRTAVSGGRAPHLLRICHRPGLSLFFGGQGRPHYPGDRYRGGTSDATNIVQPLVAVITNISPDHQDHLGHGLLAIAGEKAGIIKAGAPLVTYATRNRSWTSSAGAAGKWPRLYIEGSRFKTRGRGERRFDYHGLAKELAKLGLSLTGRHQYRNAAVALAVLELLQQQGCAISEEAIREGLQNTRWPGRLEPVAQDRRILLDGAHNPARGPHSRPNPETDPGQRAGSSWASWPTRRWTSSWGGSCPWGKWCIFTQPRYFRSATTADLARRAAPYHLEVFQVPPSGRGYPTGPGPGRARRPHRHHRFPLYGRRGQGIFSESVAAGFGPRH